MKSWNEIRKAATAFSKRWKGAYDEKSQAQSFLGFTFMSAEQKAEMLALFPKNKNLDFVCGWYKKTSDYCVATAPSPSRVGRGLAGHDGEGTVATQISVAAQAILDVRQRYLDADPACTLAILYNPETMPPDLLKAHQHLDALVDKAYGKKFANDAERVDHLFDLYAETVKG